MKKYLFFGAIFLLCSISAFGQSKKKWEQTLSLNSIEAYQNFIKKYPVGDYTGLALQQISLLKEKEKEREVKQQQRQENFLKMHEGMSPNEVISLLLFEDYINITRFDGIFIGIGLLPELNDTTNSYTGTAVLSGYNLSFTKGKLITWNIIQNELNSERFYGKLGNPYFESVTTSWSLYGKTFNAMTKRSDGHGSYESTITER